MAEMKDATGETGGNNSKKMTGKFTVPSLNDIDQVKTPFNAKRLFKRYRNEGTSAKGKADKTCESIDSIESESVNSAERKRTLDSALEDHLSGHKTPRGKSNADSSMEIEFSKNISLEERINSSGSSRQNIGKSFKETFSYLKDTHHYEEPKLRQTSGNSSDRGLKESQSLIYKPHKPNAIIVHTRQRGNPILKHIRNVPWEYGDIVPDYILGPTSCALFLSLRYHNFNPQYIHGRLKDLGKRFDLRILLIQVDVKDPHQSLRELARIAILADCTLILAWSAEEAGRYLETYKAYENKPADSLQGKVEGDYLTKLTECLTSVKSVNKTDVVTLSSNFHTLGKIIGASKEELALCPGIGPQKAQRLYDVFHEPFVIRKKTT